MSTDAFSALCEVYEALGLIRKFWEFLGAFKRLWKCRKTVFLVFLLGSRLDLLSTSLIATMDSVLHTTKAAAKHFHSKTPWFSTFSYENVPYVQNINKYRPDLKDGNPFNQIIKWSLLWPKILSILLFILQGFWQIMIIQQILSICVMYWLEQIFLQYMCRYSTVAWPDPLRITCRALRALLSPKVRLYFNREAKAGILRSQTPLTGRRCCCCRRKWCLMLTSRDKSQIPLQWLKNNHRSSNGYGRMPSQHREQRWSFCKAAKQGFNVTDEQKNCVCDLL